MSSTEVHRPAGDASPGTADVKLEVQVIPVSDVDRSSFPAVTGRSDPLR
jgi:hypothetical protein